MNQLQKQQQTNQPLQQTAQAQQTAQQQLQRDKYVQSTEISAGARMLEDYEQDHYLRSVRTVVESLMPGVYDRVDKLRSDPNVNNRMTVLHHARGAEIVAGGTGEDVLEFDMAGSSFQTPRSDYAGFKGKGQVKGADGKYRKVDRQLHKSWYNKLRAYMWIPGVRTPDEIDAENQRRLAADPIAKRFGLSQEVGEVVHEHVRRKDSAHKTRISIAGSQAIRGLSNSGEYSIENTRGYMLQMGISYLTPVFKRWHDTTPDGSVPPGVRLLIRGHSRGGVSAVEGAMMIKQWVADNYPGYLDFVKFELIQMEPVPGIGSRNGVNRQVDLSGNKTLTKGKDRMLPLGSSAETTVVYSLHSEHSDAFTPQAVMGAKRIILMADAHHVSLNQSDHAIVQHADGTNEVQNRRAAFTDAGSGEVFRGSGLSELGEGVYISDEANTLIRLDSYEQAKQVMTGVLGKVAGGVHRERHAVIDEVVKAWFAAHPQAAAPGAPAAGGNAAPAAPGNG